MHSESHGRSKYVVTGGAGFIGSHLCDRLLADSRTETVVCVDNLQTGTMDNIAEALRDPRFHFVGADVRQPIALDAELTVGVDAVFHLASPASPPAYMEDPVGTMLTGAVGTLHAAQFALEHGARIVYSSTSEVYGDPMQHPQAESYWGNVNPIGPRACYDEGKRFGEALLTSMKQQHGLDAHRHNQKDLSFTHAPTTPHYSVTPVVMPILSLNTPRDTPRPSSARQHPKPPIPLAYPAVMPGQGAGDPLCGHTLQRLDTTPKRPRPRDIELA